MISALGQGDYRPKPDAMASEARDLETLRVRAAQRGDRSAMDALVRCHQDRVYGFLYRLTDDRELALDLTQETFLKAFKHLKGFRSEAPLGPWLLAIARNLFRDHARLQRVEPLEPQETGEEDPALKRLDADVGVMEALQQVPSPFREALLLRHLEDLSYDQIAQVLEAPLGTVKTWIHRGRERLRHLLEKGGGA